MVSRQNILDRLTEKMGTRRFSTGAIRIPLSQLIEILAKLNAFNPSRVPPENLRLRPEKVTRPYGPEGYRERMTEYIRGISGIDIPPSTLVTARFYNEIADYLDRQVSQRRKA